jgi:hypothetical protein
MRRSGAAAGGVMLGIAALLLAGCGTTSTAAGRAASTRPSGTATATGTGPSSVSGRQLGKADGWAVRGTFQVEGGPSNGPLTRPLRGVVTFRGASGRTTDITAGPTGQFAGYLPAGTYTVTARTPQIRQQNSDGSFSDPACTGPVTVTVRPGPATRVALVCYVP